MMTHDFFSEVIDAHSELMTTIQKKFPAVWQ